MKIWMDLAHTPGIQCWILFDGFSISFDEEWQVRYYDETHLDDEDFTEADFTLIYESHE